MKLHLSFLLLVLWLCCFGVGAQPQLVWNRTYWWHESLSPTDIVSTDDGGFFIAGFADHDAYLAKIDRSGEYIWTETYGGTQDEYIWSAVRTPNGDFMLVGDTSSFGAGLRDAYVVRVDARGEMIWQQAYGGGGNDYGYVAVDSGDGGLVLAGTTDNPVTRTDVHLLKIDGNGEKLWERVYEGSGWDSAYGIARTTDDGFIIVGNTTSWYGTELSDLYVLRVDRNGQKMWEKAYGGSDMDTGLDVVQAEDGGYIIAGYTYSLGVRAYLLKIDEEGDKIWEKTYRGRCAHSLIRSWDGGYIVAGGIGGGGGMGMYVLRIDEHGEQLWDETYRGDGAVSIIQSTDGAFAILGYSFPRHMHIVKAADPIHSIYFLRQQLLGMRELSQALSASISALGQDVNELQEDLVFIDETLAETRVDVAGLGEQYLSTLAELALLSSGIDQLMSSVHEISTTLQAVNQSLMAQAFMNRTLVEMKASVAKLWEEYLGSRTELASLATDIDQLMSTVSDVSITLEAVNQSLTIQALELDMDRELILARLGLLETTTAGATNLTATMLFQLSEEIAFMESFIEREFPALNRSLGDAIRRETASLLENLSAHEQSLEQQLRLLNMTAQAQHESVTDLFNHFRAEEDRKHKGLQNLVYFSILLWAAAASGLLLVARRRRGPEG